VSVVPIAEPGIGQPRSQRDAAFFGRYEATFRWPIIAAAVLPLIIVPESGTWLGIAVGVVSWLVFLLDFVVHERRLVHYLRTLQIWHKSPELLLWQSQGGEFAKSQKPENTPTGADVRP